MRIRFVLAVAVLSGVMGVSGCNSDGDKEPSPPEVDRPTAEDDAAVIRLGLQHFSTQKVEFAFTGREAKSVIVIHRESAGPATMYLSDTQMSSDTQQENWVVPVEAGESIRRRNEKKVPLAGLKLGDAIVMVDLDAEPNWEFLDPRKLHPDAKAFAEIWLPGYTTDRRTAVVRFEFGPTPHGATATYLLTKKDGSWTVQKWAFAFYA